LIDLAFESSVFRFLSESILKARPTEGVKMIEKEKILNCIYKAVDDSNEQLPDDQQLEKTPETVLLGKSGKLESIELVNILVATEDYLEEEFSMPISITDEKAVSEKNSPFTTIETLSGFISDLLKENADG
jgi:D-alanine--poly(phosphoribitol) ligase subunit 2